MSTTFAVVTPNETLVDASRRMIEADTGAAAVVAAGVLVGMFSERDLQREFRDGGSPTQHISGRMTGDVVTATSATAAVEAVAIMVNGRFRHLPVAIHGRVVSMISMRDLMVLASLTIRAGGHSDLDEIDTAELLATINRMRTVAA